jgi:hypothetical protein
MRRPASLAGKAKARKAAVKSEELRKQLIEALHEARERITAGAAATKQRGVKIALFFLLVTTMDMLPSFRMMFVGAYMDQPLRKRKAVFLPTVIFDRRAADRGGCQIVNATRGQEPASPIPAASSQSVPPPSRIRLQEFIQSGSDNGTRAGCLEDIRSKKRTGSDILIAVTLRQRSKRISTAGLFLTNRGRATWIRIAAKKEHAGNDEESDREPT